MSQLIQSLLKWWNSLFAKPANQVEYTKTTDENADRQAFFTKSIKDFGIEPMKYLPEVYACLLEFGFLNGSASLLLSANGDIKLMLSHGGGTILPKNPLAIQSMAYELLTVLNTKKHQFISDTDTAPPEANTSHFFIRTKSGLAKLKLGSTSELSRKSEHYDIYALGQKIITQIRESELS